MDEGSGNDQTSIETALREKVEVASRVAKSVPDFQDRAFDKILDFLLQSPPARTHGAPAKSDTSPKRARKQAGTNPSAMERIRPILDAPAELVSDNAEIFNLDSRGKVYKLLALAREKFAIDGLTTVELRAIANEKFRLGIPDGTLTGTLSKSPPTELGRGSGPGGEVLYKIFQPGIDYLSRLANKRKTEKPSEGSG